MFPMFIPEVVRVDASEDQAGDDDTVGRKTLVRRQILQTMLCVL